MSYIAVTTSTVAATIAKEGMIAHLTFLIPARCGPEYTCHLSSDTNNAQAPQEAI